MLNDFKAFYDRLEEELAPKNHFSMEPDFDTKSKLKTTPGHNF